MSLIFAIATILLILIAFLIAGYILAASESVYDEFVVNNRR